MSGSRLQVLPNRLLRPNFLERDYLSIVPIMILLSLLHLCLTKAAGAETVVSDKHAACVQPPSDYVKPPTSTDNHPIDVYASELEAKGSLYSCMWMIENTINRLKYDVADEYNAYKAMSANGDSILHAMPFFIKSKNADPKGPEFVYNTSIQGFFTLLYHVHEFNRENGVNYRIADLDVDPLPFLFWFDKKVVYLYNKKNPYFRYISHRKKIESDFRFYPYRRGDRVQDVLSELEEVLIKGEEYILGLERDGAFEAKSHTGVLRYSEENKDWLFYHSNIENGLKIEKLPDYLRFWTRESYTSDTTCKPVASKISTATLSLVSSKGEIIKINGGSKKMIASR